MLAAAAGVSSNSRKRSRQPRPNCSDSIRCTSAAGIGGAADCSFTSDSRKGAAYSSGTPAIGVGAGNAPAYIAADADVDTVAQLVIASKTFDNGLICGAEQHLVVDEAIADDLRAKLAEHGAVVLDQQQ